jgi:hypothetical protein
MRLVQREQQQKNGPTNHARVTVLQKRICVGRHLLGRGGGDRSKATIEFHRIAHMHPLESGIVHAHHIPQLERTRKRAKHIGSRCVGLSHTQTHITSNGKWAYVQARF